MAESKCIRTGQHCGVCQRPASVLRVSSGRCCPTRKCSYASHNSDARTTEPLLLLPLNERHRPKHAFHASTPALVSAFRDRLLLKQGLPLEWAPTF
jgi:hypothetical protein